jgi:hypothetical protein
MTLPVAEWARRAATLPAALVEATPRAVLAGAAPLERDARENLRRASGGDLRLSRVRSGKGARVDVKVTTQGSGSGTRALVLPVGPVSLVEGDTRRHREPFSYAGTTGAGGRRRYATAGQRTATGGIARRRRAARRGFLYIPGVGVRAYVNHPGTSGKHPVANAMRTGAGSAGRAGAAVFARTIAEHLTS